MPKSIIVEGKTTTEAISNGLKELKVSKDRVEIKVLEEHEKRSFFSILAPRVVKVELTLKEDNNKTDNIKRNTEKDIHNKSNKISKEDLESARTRVETFLKDFVSNFENLNYNIHMDVEEGFIKIEINGEDSKTLIGYRGEVLNALQVILNSIANKDSKEKARVILNVSNYREKREKSLEELADKISKTVLKTGKSVTLEPMMAYERKIIHNRLQSSDKIKTYSIGEEPHRKVVISKK